MCPRAGEGAILRCLGIGVGAHYVGGGLGAGALAASAAIMQEQCTGRREQERWPTGQSTRMPQTLVVMFALFSFEKILNFDTIVFYFCL